MAGTWVGTSGWRYPPWRATFYPRGLVQRRELEHLSRRVSSIEINGSFYSLQRPESYRAWAAQTPDDFVFAVKGSRFVTHLKQLRDVRTPVANFLASGVLALGPKLGPLLWQLPLRLRYDRGRIEEFLTLLPRSTAAAAVLATEHDDRVDGRAHTETDADRSLRHALEVRPPELPGRRRVACGPDHRYPVRRPAPRARRCARGGRLRRDMATLRGGHRGLRLCPPARRHRAVRQRLRPGSARCLGGEGPSVAGPGARRVRLLDNDAKVHAPFDAMALAERLSRC